MRTTALGELVIIAFRCMAARTRALEICPARPAAYTNRL
jgi:hypothetical protein